MPPQRATGVRVEKPTTRPEPFFRFQDSVSDREGPSDMPEMPTKYRFPEFLPCQFLTVD